MTHPPSGPHTPTPPPGPRRDDLPVRIGGSARDTEERRPLDRGLLQGAGALTPGDLETFRYGAGNLPVRTVLVDGEPWFVAADLAAVLGYRDAHNAARLVDEDDRGTHLLSTPGGQQRVTVVSEPGLYLLTMRSDMPDSKRFRRWVTHEVLPAIRETGRYDAQAVPQTLPEALRAYAAELEQHAETRAALEQAAPRAAAWDVLASAHGDFSVREAAYILNRDPAIDTGQRRLFALLRQWQLIDSRGIPYASHAEHVRLRARTYQHPISGEDRTSEQVRITARGLAYLHRRLGGTAPLAA